MRGARFQVSVDAFDRKLMNLSRERAPLSVQVSGLHEAPRTARKAPSLGHRVAEAVVDISFDFLREIGPFEPVAMQMCPPAANDHLSSDVDFSVISHHGCTGIQISGEPGGTANGKRLDGLAFLPGPLQQATLQLGASLMVECISAIEEWKHSPGRELRSARERRAELWSDLKVRLSKKSSAMAIDVVLAGCSDWVTELIGFFVVEARAICQRLLRAVRHAAAPTLKAMLALSFPVRGQSYRESVDYALQLLVQAGIVSLGVTIEDHLHQLLRPVFGRYAAVAAPIFIAILCWLATRAAIALMEQLDIVGVRRQREVRLLLAEIQKTQKINDQRIQAVIEMAHG